MKTIYCIKRWVWDQWENYGSGDTDFIRIFSNEEKAKEFLKSFCITDDEDFQKEFEYSTLEPFKMDRNRPYTKSWIIPGPIGNDVEVVYSIVEKELD